MGAMSESIVWLDPFKLHQVNLGFRRVKKLSGETRGDQFGSAVSLNSRGDVLAVGARPLFGQHDGYAKVYTHNGDSSQWDQMGDKIKGKERFGCSVSLTGDGLVFAVASYADTPGENPGYVQLFRFNRDSQSWQQLGQTLEGQDASCGPEVSLSATGMIVGVGAKGISFGGAKEVGQASVYQYDSVSSSWMLMGAIIRGPGTENYQLGKSVSLNDSGHTMAVASRNKVFVLDFDKTTQTWKQRGQTLEGVPLKRFADRVALSRNGHVLAVTASGFNFHTVVKVFQYYKKTMEWIQVGSDLVALEMFDGFGRSMSLSGNGTVIAVSGTGSDDAPLNIDRGYVRVFTLL